MQVQVRPQHYPLNVSKFHIRIHDSKGYEKKIYNIVKDRQTRSPSEVKYVLTNLEAKNTSKNLECRKFKFSGLVLSNKATSVNGFNVPQWNT